MRAMRRPEEVLSEWDDEDGDGYGYGKRRRYDRGRSIKHRDDRRCRPVLPSALAFIAANIVDSVARPFVIYE